MPDSLYYVRHCTLEFVQLNLSPFCWFTLSGCQFLYLLCDGGEGVGGGRFLHLSVTVQVSEQSWTERPDVTRRHNDGSVLMPLGPLPLLNFVDATRSSCSSCKILVKLVFNVQRCEQLRWSDCGLQNYVAVLVVVNTLYTAEYESFNFCNML